MIIANTVPWIIALVLKLLDSVFSYLYEFSTRAEKYIRKDQAAQSRTLKMFIASFLSSSIIILITNMKPKNQKIAKNLFITGDYEDTTSHWFNDMS
jgi:hypothetical protein